jgi:hypothetical protein
VDAVTLLWLAAYWLVAKGLSFLVASLFYGALGKGALWGYKWAYAGFVAERRSRELRGRPR